MTEDRNRITDHLAQSYRRATIGQRHWLCFHFSVGAITPFGNQLLAALAVIEERLPGAGMRLIRDLADIRYISAAQSKSAWVAGFEQLVQKLAEILVAKALFAADWAEGTVFAFEPTNPATGAKPEILIDTPNHQWLFEVKCPAFVEYQERRAVRDKQLPVRGPHGAIPNFRDGATLPRDNVLKDFLVSAERKFSGFSTKTRTGILIVVWDGYVFEVTSVLSHPEAGLLTDKSWHIKAGARVAFDAVDGVIVLNHLEVLKVAAQGCFAPLRKDAFTIGGAGNRPNVWCPNVGRGELDIGVSKIFDALRFDDALMTADYAPADFIMWIN